MELCSLMTTMGSFSMGTADGPEQPSLKLSRQALLPEPKICGLCTPGGVNIGSQGSGSIMHPLTHLECAIVELVHVTDLFVGRFQQTLLRMIHDRPTALEARVPA